MEHGPAVTLADILAARRTIAPHIWRTPLIHSAALSARTGADVYLKLECWQRTGSFKVRGALFKLGTLPAEASRRGLVTASAGNHGLGVAYASQVLGAPRATIFVPETTPQAKIQHLAAYDCEVRRAGADYDASHALAEAFAREQGALYISAYDDPVVIAGQGTVGLEVMEELPDADLCLVPVGGGGLIAGTSVAAKAIHPATRMLGVQPLASPSAFLSFRDGHAYETYDAGPTICDGLAGGFGRLPFEIAADLVEGVLVVSDAAVRRAVGWLVAHEQLLAEGSAAIAIAPLLDGELDVAGQKVVAVLTGRNIDANLLQDILQERRER
ncbi:MAG: pyridoxal-phosphate dependent enzyme [Anaerolineae bacterium]|nr:pyridoxal-phosphate dependent enzyme [Anaerolineae bacterium]